MFQSQTWPKCLSQIRSSFPVPNLCTSSLLLILPFQPHRYGLCGNPQPVLTGGETAGFGKSSNFLEWWDKLTAPPTSTAVLPARGNRGFLLLAHRILR